ncbi:hypothetical protein LUZ60_008589 [Juncus effusus]|nr:hypothetical protein LUZ60_008589 [Juncus effusus]
MAEKAAKKSSSPTPTLLLLFITFSLLLFLLLISLTPKQPTTFHRHHRRLKLRTNFSGSGGNHTSFYFDPVIADYEQQIEDHQWELDHQLDSNHTHEDLTEWEEYMRAQNYINNEERFNMTDRIFLLKYVNIDYIKEYTQLFPLIDLNPSDGHVSAQELARWHLDQERKQRLHRTEKEMGLHDKDKDGFVSFEEYNPSKYAIEGTHYDKESWWREEHFNASDIDGDGRLNLTEFDQFLHPSEDSNPKLIKWLSKQIIRERDTKKDGKLDFKEFFEGLYDRLKDMDSDHREIPEDSRNMKAQHLFVRLDSNLDGYLTEDEMGPIVSRFYPSENYYIREHVDYIMSVADQNKDGYLTLKEMIDNQESLYGALYEDEHEDFDDYYHDEFR